MHKLLLLLLVVGGVLAGTSLPSWTRDYHIDAGEVKTVNFLNFTKAAGTNVTTSQHYNYTNFSSIPRVALGMISYGIIKNGSLGSLDIGYDFVLFPFNDTKKFYYIATFKGVTCMSLHFIYLAVEGYTDYFYIQTYNFNFNSSTDALVDVSVANRSTLLERAYPQGMQASGNLSSGELAIYAWPYSFTLKPVNNTIAYNLTITALNYTHFSLNLSASFNCSISAFGVFVVAVNRTKFLFYKYAHIVDISEMEILGNFTAYEPTSTTMTNTATQYQYRNSLMGNYAAYFPLDTMVNYYYFNYSTTNGSVHTGRAMQTRVRVCAGGSYYMYQDMLCYSPCPSHFYTNFTEGYCIACHYSCDECSFGADAFGCSLCVGSYQRTLNSTAHSCACNPHYYDNNTALCVGCDYSCYTCSGTAASQCLSCSTATSHRLLSNGSCLCDSNFYDNNTFICASCHYTCLTCVNDTSTGCLTCNSSLQRTISNNTCPCQSSFYTNTSCIACPNYCLTCQLTNVSFVECKSCNATLFRVINSALSACVCKTGYEQNNTVCQQLVTPICGDGFKGTSQECDDGNRDNLDGCSSMCRVQTDHACFDNSSVYNTSVCYYVPALTFKINQVYKYPLQNRVKLTIQTIAANCNQTYLKQYLEQRPSIELLANRGLLQSDPSVSSQVAAYDSSSRLLTVDFQYSQDIDLTTKTIRFQPSQSAVVTADRYFYSSASASVALQKPTNGLLTTFVSADEVSGYRKMGYAFMAVVIACWMFILVAGCYGQAAIAVETMLILQIAYEGLLQSGFIYEGWVGLLEYGRYTYGYNVQVVGGATFDRLQMLNLSAYLLDTLNIAIGAVVLPATVLVGMFLYEAVKYHRETVEVDEPTQAKIESEGSAGWRERKREEEGAHWLGLKKWVTVMLLEILFVFMFLTGKIAVATIPSITSASSTTSIAALVALGGSYLVGWYFYFRGFDLDLLKDFSFRRLLRDGKHDDPHWTGRLGDLLARYYYLVLFGLLLLFGLLAGLPSLGAAFYVSSMGGCILLLVVIGVFAVYLRTEHTVRACCNILCVLTILVLQLLQSLQITTPKQTTVQPLIGLAAIFTSLTLNFSIFLRIQLKKHRKRTTKKRRARQPKITMHNETQAPEMQIDEKLHFEEEIRAERNQIQMSHEAMAKEEKEGRSQERESQRSYAETNKKLAVLPQQSLTKEKGIRESFEEIEGIGQEDKQREQEERQSNLDHIEIMSLSNNFSALASPKRITPQPISIRPSQPTPSA